MATHSNPEGSKKAADEHADEGTSERRWISDSVASMCFLNFIRKGAYERPTIHLKNAQVVHTTLDKLKLVVDALVKNPNPLPVEYVRGEYYVESDGRRLGCGTISMEVLVINSAGTISLPIDLNPDDIKTAWPSIEPGSILPYRLAIDLVGEQPLVKTLSWHMELTGLIPVPDKPIVILEEIQFQDLSFDKASVLLHVKMANKNEFRLRVRALGFELRISGMSTGSAAFAQPVILDKNEAAFLKIPMQFSPKNVGPALWFVITTYDHVGYSMKGSSAADTAFGKMELAIITECGTTILKKPTGDGADQVCTMMASLKWMLEEGIKLKVEKTVCNRRICFS